MSDQPSKPDELLALFSQLVDGESTPASAERLAELLRDDPEAQDLYLKFMRVNSVLHLDYASGFSPADLHFRPAQPPPEPAEPLGSELASPAGDALAGAGNGPSRVWIASMAVGWTLALLFAIGLAARLWPSRTTTSSTGARPRPTAVDVSDGVAVVVRARGAMWETDGGYRPREGDVLAKGRIRLREGRVILSMLSGVAVVAEAPAEFDLVSVDRIDCRRGKLRARAPLGSEGFVISGPGSAIVDLGTEFGVNVTADGKSHGKVFDGEVEAAILGSSGTLRHSRVVDEGNAAFEIDPGSGLIRPATANEEFAQPWNLGIPSLVLDPSYRDSVLASHPRCYWRFESADKGTIANEVPGRPPLLVTGPIQLRSTSPGNRAAAFRPDEPLQYLRMDGLWKPERTPGYAIELWFVSEQISQTTLVSMVAPADTMNHLTLLELTGQNRLSLYRPASVRFLYRWPSSRSGGDNVFSNAIYVPYRWHYLVAQVGGDRMELYLDGAAEGPLSIDPNGATVPAQLLLGRLTTLARSNDTHHSGYRRAFIGLMDEVAIHDRLLTTEEIQARYRLATRSDTEADSRPETSSPASGERSQPTESK